MDAMFGESDESKSARSAGFSSSSSQSHISSHARTAPGNSRWRDAETATTSALRAALAAPFRTSPNPEHVEVPHLFFKCFARRTDQSFQEPPRARACGDVFINQHRFEDRILSGFSFLY